MRMERIGSGNAWREAVIVRLLRRWTAAREQGLASPASLFGLAAELGIPPHAAVALDSLLQLTESCLGRRLRSECCCSEARTADETALLMLIATAPCLRPGSGNATMPHGLPAALLWAALSLNHLLGETLAAPVAPPGNCPFGTP